MKNIYSTLEDSREKALFGIMISTGLRVCEISTALIEDINNRDIFMKGIDYSYYYEEE